MNDLGLWGLTLPPEAERGVEKASAEVVKSLGELGREVTAKTRKTF